MINTYSHTLRRGGPGVWLRRFASLRRRRPRRQRGDSKLVENMLDVRLRGAVADEEALGDDAIGAALAEKPEDLELTGRELIGTRCNPHGCLR